MARALKTYLEAALLGLRPFLLLRLIASLDEEEGDSGDPNTTAGPGTGPPLPSGLIFFSGELSGLLPIAEMGLYAGMVLTTFLF